MVVLCVHLSFGKYIGWECNGCRICMDGIQQSSHGQTLFGWVKPFCAARFMWSVATYGMCANWHRHGSSFNKLHFPSVSHSLVAELTVLQEMINTIKGLRRGAESHLFRSNVFSAPRKWNLNRYPYYLQQKTMETPCHALQLSYLHFRAFQLEKCRIMSGLPSIQRTTRSFSCCYLWKLWARWASFTHT